MQRCSASLFFSIYFHFILPCLFSPPIVLTLVLNVVDILFLKYHANLYKKIWYHASASLDINSYSKPTYFVKKNMRISDK